MFKLIYADSRFNWGDWPTILGGKAEQKHIARSCHDLGFDSGSRWRNMRQLYRNSKGYPVSVCFAFLSPLLGWADASDPLWFGHPSKRYCIVKPADMQLPWLIISRTISGILCSAVVITCASSSKSQVTILRNLPSEHVCQVQKPLQWINCWWFLLLFVLLFVFFEDLMKAYMRTGTIIIADLLNGILKWVEYQIRYFMLRTYGVDGCLTCRNLGLWSGCLKVFFQLWLGHKRWVWPSMRLT